MLKTAHGLVLRVPFVLACFLRERCCPLCKCRSMFSLISIAAGYGAWRCCWSGFNWRSEHVAFPVIHARPLLVLSKVSAFDLLSDTAVKVLQALCIHHDMIVAAVNGLTGHLLSPAGYGTALAGDKDVVREFRV
jgi:hypothetical protein